MWKQPTEHFGTILIDSNNKGLTAMLLYLTKEDDQNSFVEEHQHVGYHVKLKLCIHTLQI